MKADPTQVKAPIAEPDVVNIAVIQAALASTSSLGFISSVMAVLCGLLIIFTDSLPVRIIALTGLLSALLQAYYFWRVSLDKRLLPILLKHGSAPFDQALHSLFPAKARSLNTATLNDRLQGIKKLFFRLCALAIVQSVLTILSLVLLLTGTTS